MSEPPKRPRGPPKPKWTKNGRLRGRPPGSRSYDLETSRADDPITKPPERRGRPPLKSMTLRFVQMAVGQGVDGFAKQVAEKEAEEGREVSVRTVKRRIRRDRSDALQRRKRFKDSGSF